MDIYGNKRQLFTTALNRFAKSDYTESKLQQKLRKTGNTMSGVLDLGNNRLTGVLNPSSAQDASTKTYTNNIGSLKVSKSVDVMSGSIDMNLNKITDVADPINAQDVVTKNYLHTYYLDIFE